MMGAILRLTKTHLGTLTAEEEAALQQAQQAAWPRGVGDLGIGGSFFP